MKLQCFECGKAVTNEIPYDIIFRATATCPEYEEKKPDHEANLEDQHERFRALIREIEMQGHKTAGLSFITGLIIGVIVARITWRVIQCMF